MDNNLNKTKDCCIAVFTDEANQLASVLNTLIDNKNYYLAEKVVNDLSISISSKDRLIKCIRSYENSC